ncbi:UDP-N-acetylglucosamine transferase subunit ALG14 homolog [Diorhabda sublineata]|uniref:UDP-N-acetylglucosamine transferase subunit ALG14 homolog n=1 Tax=Diorhabda sublineata TaxID=1163346 RepID=UPI0024E108E1|nr:UDP-N-acetylglucosamine transferase subunit ALG14 homolog [Diorhabda sublineata]
METQLKVELCILFIILVIARLLFLIHKITTGHSKYASNKRIEPCKTIICIGSGGHTTEMISLLSTLDFRKYSPRYYIIATTDTTSLTKVESLETSKSTQLREKDYFIKKIPRSRVVQQSYFTSIFTTIFSILYSIPLVLKIRPDLVLCNGPGTCIPICVIGFLLKSFFITDTKIVFIESFCRTKTLSLTGKILVYLADNFIVQWPNLRKKLKRADYIGQLM